MSNRSYTVSIDADTSGLEAGKRRAQALVSELGKYKATVQVDGDTTKLDQRINARATQLATRLDDQRAAAQVATGARNRLQAAGVSLAPDAEEKQFQAWLAGEKALGAKANRMASLVGWGAMAAAARTVDSGVAAAGAYTSALDSGMRTYGGSGSSGRATAEALAGIAAVSTATRDLQRLPIIGTMLANALDRARASAEALAGAHMELASASRQLSVRSATNAGDTVKALALSQQDELRKELNKSNQARDEQRRAQEQYDKGWLLKDRWMPWGWSSYANLEQANANVQAADANVARLKGEQRREMSRGERMHAASVQGMATRYQGARFAERGAMAMASGDTTGAFIADLAAQDITFRSKQAEELAGYTPGTAAYKRMKSTQGAELEAFGARQTWSLMQYAASTPFALTTNALAGASGQGTSLDPTTLLAQLVKEVQRAVAMIDKMTAMN